MGFQTSVAINPAPAIAGDFASANPRFTALAGPGGFKAGIGGLTIGRFAWADPLNVDGDGAPAYLRNDGWGAPIGFIGRQQEGMITTYLAESGNVIQPGFQSTAYVGGDFWVKNDGSGAVVPGMKAYAEYGSGKVSFAATASPDTATNTSFTISAQTWSSAGSTITGNVLTTGPSVTGSIKVGSIATGSGVTTGTQIVAQLSGVAGGVGTYAVNYEQEVASTTISGSYGVLTLSGTNSGTFRVGQTLTATDVSATKITALGTGVGGNGTYIVDKTQTSSTGTITGAANVETKWRAASAGGAGELIKITSEPAAV